MDLQHARSLTFSRQNAPARHGKATCDPTGLRGRFQPAHAGPASPARGSRGAPAHCCSPNELAFFVGAVCVHKLLEKAGRKGIAWLLVQLVGWLCPSGSSVVIESFVIESCSDLRPHMSQ